MAMEAAECCIVWVPACAIPAAVRIADDSASRRGSPVFEIDERVPHGYHGPSMAAPGYHLYYLTVLAGPADQRSMTFSFDPAHAWVRDALSSQPVDPRLPLTSAPGTAAEQGPSR